MKLTINYTKLFFGLFILLACNQGLVLAAGLQEINDQGMSLNLSLQQAIDDAKGNNVLLKIAEEQINEAKGRRGISDSDLLPHISFGASQGRVFWENFAAQGMPSFGVIGPFNTFDARFQVTQRIFDLSAISKLQAANEDVDIANYKEKLAIQQVSTAAVIAYLDVLQAQEQLQAVQKRCRLSPTIDEAGQTSIRCGHCH